MQSYYQTEGQLAEKLGDQPRLNRPFFQVSTMEIDPQRVKQLYQQGLAVYPGMLFIPDTDRFYIRQGRLDGPQAKVRLTSLADPNKIENRLLLGDEWLVVIVKAFRALLESDSNFVTIEVPQGTKTVIKVRAVNTLTYLLMVYPNKQPFAFITEPVHDSSALRLMFLRSGDEVPPSLKSVHSPRGVRCVRVQVGQSIDMDEKDRRILGRLKYLRRLSPFEQHQQWQGSLAQGVLENDLK